MVVECFHTQESSGDQPTDVCDQAPPNHNQLLHAFAFSCHICQSSFSTAQGFNASSLGVIIRTPLGGIAAHARDRPRTRQAR